MYGEPSTPAVESITVRSGYPAPRPPHLRQILIELPGRPVGLDRTHGLAYGGGDAPRWRDREIIRLESLLADGGLGSGPAPSAVDGAGARQLLGLLQTEQGVNREALTDLLTTMVSTKGLVNAIRELDVAGQLSSLIEQAHRQRGLARLVEVIDDRASTREDLRAAVERESWVFGGRYIPPHEADKVPGLRRIPLPLMRTDGAIHVVEVGPANVPDLITPIGRGSSTQPEIQYGVGIEVQNAVSRAIDQLRLLDELSAEIWTVLRIETRRALATVLIGHPRYLADRTAQEALQSTLRTYSSHLAGVEVIGYDELVYSAERALAMDEPSTILDADV